jgi:hypothetical protein
LKPYLEWLYRNKGVTGYVWKAELTKAGTLHYHLTINRFVVYTELKETWNRLLDKAGLLENFYAKYGHRQPNSIDIHAVKNVRDIEAYLVKYIVKGDSEGRKIEGKIWGASENLKKGKRFTIHPSQATLRRVEYLEQRGLAKRIEGEQCDILAAGLDDSLTILSEQELNDYKEHMEAIRKNRPAKTTTHQERYKSQKAGKQTGRAKERSKQLEIFNSWGR